MNEIIANTSVISPLLPIVVFLSFRKRNDRKALWVIFIYTIFAFLFDCVHSLNITPHVEFTLYRVFTIIEYMCFSYYLSSILQFKLKNWLILIIGIIIVAFNIKYLSSSQIVEEFDAVTTSIEAIFIIMLCIIHFYEVIQKNTVSIIYADKSFWLVAAMLVYLSANLFLFITSKYLTPEERTFYWFINDTSNTLKNILFTIAFLLPMSDQVKAKKKMNSYEQHPFLN